jgi:hypothetical protein
MHDEKTITSLRIFCEKEMCMENILFMEDYKKLMSLTDYLEIKNMSRRMLKKYLDSNSEYELNLPSFVKDNMNKYRKLDKKLWVEVHNFIMTDIKNDILPRYRKLKGA